MLIPIWHVERETSLHRMVTDITREKKNMLIINYERPSARIHTTQETYADRIV